MPIPPSVPRRGPVVLCILDGVGIGAHSDDDAVWVARTPNLDRYFETCPWMTLKAHGTAVGLPSDADMGNSEVGHNAMGAGRVFDQGAKLVNEGFSSGKIFQSGLWKDLVMGQTLHLIGLVSDGNVHSHIDHLNQLIERAAVDGVKRLRVHVLTDGRDVAPRSALRWVEPLEARLRELSTDDRDYCVASGGGRMVMTMDRYEADWEMVARGWRAHVHGEGRPFGSASEAISVLYAEDPGVDDQNLAPFVIVRGGHPCGTVQDGDSALFFNFRGDRAIEISRAFEDMVFPHFHRVRRPAVTFGGMMQYDGDLKVPKRFLVEPPEIHSPVAELLAQAHKRSFACSETQKFGHVTYFFNGNRSQKFDALLEDWTEVPSDRFPFEDRPWMKAAEVTDAVVEAIRIGHYHHVRLNYANGDMVGHTGVLEATILAVEAVDLQLKRLERAVREADGILLITADHGNADEMWMREKGKVKADPNGVPTPKTSHTLAPVPFIVVDPRGELGVVPADGQGIASIGATILELCGVVPPDEFLPGLVR